MEKLAPPRNRRLRDAASIHVRLDDSQRKQVVAFAEAQGMSVNESIRTLLRLGVESFNEKYAKKPA